MKKQIDIQIKFPIYRKFIQENGFEQYCKILSEFEVKAVNKVSVYADSQPIISVVNYKYKRVPEQITDIRTKMVQCDAGFVESNEAEFNNQFNNYVSSYN